MNKRFLVFGAVAAILAMSAFAGIAGAQTGDQKNSQPGAASRPAVLGVVTSISGSSLTVQGNGVVYTVNVTPRTKIIVASNGKCVAVKTIASIQVNQPVSVVGMSSANATNVIQAATITQGACGAGATNKPSTDATQGSGDKKPGQTTNNGYSSHVALGTIQSVGTDSIIVAPDRSVERNAKEVTIAVNQKTVVLNNGFTTVSSLRAGDKIQVVSAPGGPAAHADKSSMASTAWIIRVVTDNSKLLIGKVVSVNGNSITIAAGEKANANVTVTVDANTGYRLAATDRSLSAASLSSVQVGNNVMVAGTVAGGKVQSSNGLAAQAVIVLPATSPSTHVDK